MRSLLVFIALWVYTVPYAAVLVTASLLRVKDRPGGLYERLMRSWGRALCRAAGVRIRLHNAERMSEATPVIYVSNHVSWFDVFVLAAVLPRCTFVAKAELRKIPIFGAAAEAVGVVFLERTNRKAAFDSYKHAAGQAKMGKSIIVYPEGTRGRDYHLRPFKKGPFVLAISAGAPIVPTVIYGTIRVHPKGSMWIRAGTVDVHFLEPVPTAGLSYDQRDALMRTVWQRMADALRAEHGVGTAESPIAPEPEQLGRQAS